MSVHDGYVIMREYKELKASRCDRKKGWKKFDEWVMFGFVSNQFSVLGIVLDGDTQLLDFITLI